MSAQMEKLREALPHILNSWPDDPSGQAWVEVALAEIEEWETRDADYAGYGEIMEALTARAEAAEAEANDLNTLLDESLDREKVLEAEADRLKAALEAIDRIDPAERGLDTAQMIARAALAPADRNTT